MDGIDAVVHIHAALSNHRFEELESAWASILHQKRGVESEVAVHIRSTEELGGFFCHWLHGRKRFQQRVHAIFIVEKVFVLAERQA